MALLRQEPRPRDPLVDDKRNITYRWGIFIDALLQTITQQPTLPTQPTRLTQQAASVGATPLSLGTNNEGLFRVSWFLRIITLGGTTGTAQVVVRSTDGVAACVQSGAVLDQAVNTVQSGSFLVRRDQGTPITFEVTYTSTGVPDMEFNIDVVVEVVNQQITT